MDLQRRITAYHEAAHAVIAFRFRIPIRVVALCDASELQGYVEMARPSLISTVLRDKSPLIVSWPEVVRDTEERAMVFLAGPVAEAKLHGTRLRSHCCESDLLRCYTLCSILREYGQRLAGEQGLRIPEVNVAAMANELRGRTARFLGHFRTWSAVTELATDLEGWSQLTGDEAADTVAWTKRVENQLSLMLPMTRVADRTRAEVRVGPRAHPCRPSLTRQISRMELQAA